MTRTYRNIEGLLVALIVTIGIGFGAVAGYLAHLGDTEPTAALFPILFVAIVTIAYAAGWFTEDRTVEEDPTA